MKITLEITSPVVYLRAFLIAQLKKSVSNAGRQNQPWFDSWVGKICWKRDKLLTPVFLDFPCDSTGKESTCNAGNLGAIPGLGRSPGEGKGYPLQHSGLENSMDCVAHGVAKRWTQLSNLHLHLHFFGDLFRETLLSAPTDPSHL